MLMQCQPSWVQIPRSHHVVMLVLLPLAFGGTLLGTDCLIGSSYRTNLGVAGPAVLSKQQSVHRIS